MLLVPSLTLNVARMTLCTFCLLVALNTSHITAATGYLRRKVSKYPLSSVLFVGTVCLFVCSFVINEEKEGNSSVLFVGSFVCLFVCLLVHTIIKDSPWPYS